VGSACSKPRRCQGAAACSKVHEGGGKREGGKRKRNEKALRKQREGDEGDDAQRAPGRRQPIGASFNRHQTSGGTADFIIYLLARGLCIQQVTGKPEKGPHVYNEYQKRWPKKLTREQIEKKRSSRTKEEKGKKTRFLHTARGPGVSTEGAWERSRNRWSSGADGPGERPSSPSESEACTAPSKLRPPRRAALKPLAQDGESAASRGARQAGQRTAGARTRDKTSTDRTSEVLAKRTGARGPRRRGARLTAWPLKRDVLAREVAAPSAITDPRARAPG